LVDPFVRQAPTVPPGPRKPPPLFRVCSEPGGSEIPLPEGRAPPLPRTGVKTTALAGSRACLRGGLSLAVIRLAVVGYPHSPRVGLRFGIDHWSPPCSSWRTGVRRDLAELGTFRTTGKCQRWRATTDFPGTAPPSGFAQGTPAACTGIGDRIRRRISRDQHFPYRFRQASAVNQERCQELASAGCAGWPWASAPPRPDHKDMPESLPDSLRVVPFLPDVASPCWEILPEWV
jgi:hypothetical protein